jgi:hypothetical protein
MTKPAALSASTRTMWAVMPTSSRSISPRRPTAQPEDRIDESPHCSDNSVKPRATFGSPLLFSMSALRKPSEGNAERPCPIEHEETTDPPVADVRNFYKVEKWTRDGTKVDSLLYAGNSLGTGSRGVRE